MFCVQYEFGFLLLLHKFDQNFSYFFLPSHVLLTNAVMICFYLAWSLLLFSPQELRFSIGFVKDIFSLMLCSLVYQHHACFMVAVSRGCGNGSREDCWFPAQENQRSVAHNRCARRGSIYKYLHLYICIYY